MSTPDPVEPEPVSFEREGARCAASLCRPTESPHAGDPPIVVMANGFGLPRSAGLPAFAERFAERGLAVLLFDYRSLGGGGAFAAARENVDAYVGQNSILDGSRTLPYLVRQMGPAYGLRTTVAGLRDLGRKYTGREPYYVPIWGDYPEELPALPTPGSKEGHGAVAGDAADDPRVNRCTPRAFITFRLYRPVANARKVDRPTLVVQGAHDLIAPRSAISATVDRLRDVRWMTVDADHFGAFSGDVFEEVVEAEGEFLERHLLGEGEEATIANEPVA